MTQQDPTAQLARIQAAASPLINRLCERAAYASKEEFEEIRCLVKELRQITSATFYPGGESTSAAS